MVTMKLGTSQTWFVLRNGIVDTYAINKLAAVPMVVRTNEKRTSFKRRAIRTSLSYFSLKTGTKSMNVDRSIPATDMKIANPVKPAGKKNNA